MSEATQAPGGGCEVPPPGWRCSRPQGHEGPCAAVPAHEAAAHTPEPWDDTEFTGPGGSPLATAEEVAVAVGSAALPGGAFLFGATADGHLDEAGRHRVVCFTGNGPASAANSRRIVACVNACRGIPNGALASGVVAELVAFVAELAGDADGWTPVRVKERAAATLARCKRGGA